MAKYEVGDIRNVAFFGHGNTGKTTLAEQMLVEAGVLKRAGSVDEGTSNLDFEDEERERKHTIDSSIVHFSWRGKEINLIDTPGYSDFIASVIGAAAVVETAVITIAAPAGIEVNTRRVWAIASEAGLAKVILISKMDGENIDFPALLKSIQEVFGSNCVPLFLPVGVGGDFQGIVNVLSPPNELPAGVVGDVDAAKEAITESIVEANDELLEKYLGEEQISAEELSSAFVGSMVAGQVVPILCCSTVKGIGVKEVMDFLAMNTPSPVEGLKRRYQSGEEEVEITPDPNGPFIAQVFKCLTDPFVGKVSFFRVFSGTMTAGQVYNSRTGRAEKVTQIFRPQAREQEQVERAIPGDIIGVTKVEGIAISDTLCDREANVSLPKLIFPQPMVAVAVEPKARGDEQRISEALSKIADEDPTFKVSRDTQTNELVITGMSTLHLDVILSRLKNRFGVEVTTKEPKIPYRETITRNAEGKYRHKKQTGGRGQFAEVWLRIEPLERGAGFEFVDEIVGGAIPSQFIPAVEKGIREAMQQGIIAGYPVQDLRVRVYDGKDHPVDSSEAAFKIAAARAFKNAFMEAKPVLLEPIVNMEIVVPSKYMGDISGDLNSRRGRIVNVDASGDMQIIKAQVPMAEVMNYATQLRSITGGTGSFTMEFSHYDVVPARIAEAVIAKSKPREEEE